jgi:hypothetical protein
MIGQLNLTLWAWIESARGLRRKRVWGPFLIMGGIEVLCLLALTGFYHPLLSWLMAPLVRLAGSEVLLHYPEFYIGLPGLFSRVSLATDWLFGSVFFGTAALLIWRLAAGVPQGDPYVEARRSYFDLLLLRTPALLLAILVFFFLPRILSGAGGEIHGNRLRLLRYGGFLAAVGVDALFLYGPVARLVARRSLGGSFRETLHLASRVPLATFLVVLVPNLVQIPLSAALRRSDVVVRNLAPETVFWMVLASVLVYLAINYFIVSSAVRIFGARAASLGGES